MIWTCYVLVNCTDVQEASVDGGTFRAFAHGSAKKLIAQLMSTPDAGKN
jgi:hypothetical protein